MKLLRGLTQMDDKFKASLSSLVIQGIQQEKTQNRFIFLTNLKKKKKKRCCGYFSCAITEDWQKQVQEGVVLA